MKQQELIRKIRHVFRHEWDGCRCTFCGKEKHDFRDACNQTPKDAYRIEGVFTCTRCKATFHRVIVPHAISEECLQCHSKECIKENISYCSGHELTDTTMCELYEVDPTDWIEEWIVRPGNTEREAYVKFPY